MNDLLLPAVQKSTQDLDPYYNLVSLHLKGDVSTGRNYNAFSDASSNNFRLTNNGDARGTSFSPYNTSWSAFFDGTGDYLSATGSAATQMGTGAFTWECWCYILGASAYQGFIDTRTSPSSGSATGMALFLNTGTLTPIVATTGTILTSSINVTANSWNHVALTRSSGGTLTIWVNGSSGGTVSNSSNLTDTSIWVGGNSSSPHPAYVNGYLSNVRMTKGADLYTTPFTPPTSSLTTTVSSGTVSLLTCQSNRFLDASTNNFTITRNGDTRISSFSPFLETDTTSGSGYFDGTGDNILTPSNTSFALGSDWTYELWFYPISQSGSGGIVGFTDNIDNLDYTLSSNSLIYYDGSTVTTWSGVNPVVGSWNHIAIVKSSGTIRAYVNGKQSTNTASGPTTSSARSVYIGSNRVGTSTTACYIADFRIVKGTAVYTAAFTPPAAPLTAVANTQLLTLQERGAYNTVGFQDESEYQHVITRNPATGPNAPTQGTFSPFSQTGWSNYFDGNGDSLSIASNAVLAPGTGNFWIECWINLNNLPSSGSTYVVLQNDALGVSGSDKFWFGLYNNSGTYRLQLGRHNTADASYVNWTPTVSTWYHIAYGRSSGTSYLFIDGVSQTVTGSLSGVSFGQNGAVIGAVSTPYYFPGYISNLRYIVGAVLYTATFTPSSVPLTTTSQGASASQVEILTCQSNRFLDASTNNFAITRNGDTSVVAFSPFKPPAYNPQVHGGSGYFDTSGDYLTAPASSNLALGTSAFTLEVWYYPLSFSTDAIFESRSSSGSAGGYAFLNTSDGKLNVYQAGGFLGASSTGLTLNAWNHVAIVRSGTGTNQTTYYINGVSVGTITISANLTDASTVATYIGGSSNGTELVHGYLCDARIVKGTAVYTSNFTPPTAPLTAITNTSLLLNFTNAGVIDSTGKNVIETVGNAGVVTAIKKFGTGSMYFDGTGDVAIVPNSALFTLGTNNFTIESWVYVTQQTTNQYYSIFGKRPSTGNQSYIALSIRNNLAIFHFAGSNSGAWSSMTTGNINIPLNTWTHIALARNGSAFNVYINGTRDSGASITSAASVIDNSTPFYIGTGTTDTGGEFFVGYLADFRFTNGYARYVTGTGANAGQMVFNGTNTLALPTKALPDRGRAS